MTTVLFEKKGAIAKIKLNRPEIMNALNDELLSELAETMRKFTLDPEVKIIILCGAGDNFCAGEDLKVAAQHQIWVLQGKMTGWELNDKFTQYFQDFTRYQRDGKKIWIAAPHGWAVGAGFEMVIGCDLVVAAKGTRFGFPELEAGMSITNGATKLLPAKIGLNRASDWMLTGRWIEAEEAYNAGLVTKIAEKGEEEKVAEDLANLILSKKWHVVLSHKRLLNASLSSDLESMMWFEQAMILAGSLSVPITDYFKK